MGGLGAQPPVGSRSEAPGKILGTLGHFFALTVILGTEKQQN